MDAANDDLRVTVKQIGHFIGLLAAKHGERFAPELMADPQDNTLFRELAAGIEAGQAAGRNG